MSHVALMDASVCQLLLVADQELAEQARTEGCECGGRLHSARYPRKPRPGDGLPEELRGAYRRRESLCCAQCRKRRTPPSLRFLGRRVYLAAVVVLVSAMTGGVTEKRAARMRALVGVDRRTLQRWRSWWLHTFVRTAFWRSARARLMPLVEEGRLPASLLERFSESEQDEELVACLRFLAPITTRTG